MKKNKKSLRIKMVSMIIEKFASDKVNDNWNIELQNKLKDTFSFKCKLLKFKTTNSDLTGTIEIEKENGETTMLNFIFEPKHH